MRKKTVTLYVDDSSLRLLVVQGRRVKKWAESALEPGLVKSSIVVDEAAVAARVKQLFKTQKVSTRKVIVGLSGLHCLTRPMTLPPLPKAMLGEAVLREATRVLPVPPDQLYISWQVVPAPEGKVQVFLVAVPCKTADPLLRTLRKAGLKPYLMDLKPLALARVLKEPTAVIIDVQPTEFDIVIVSSGVPQPIRTVPLPSETLPQKEKWQKVKEELDRTINFYNSNNPDSPLGAEVPIYVSGELANRPRLSKSLSEEVGFPVLTLTPPDYTGEVDPTRYMVNLGLALKEPSSGQLPLPSLVNVNALPAPYQPKPIPLLKMIALPSMVAFIGLAVLLTTVVQDASANVATTSSQLKAVNTLIEQKQQKKKELTKAVADLEKKLSQTQASHTTFQAALTTLDRQHERITGDLTVTTGSVPITIDLTGISQTAERLTIQGRSPDEVEILAYSRSLESSGRFSETTISSITRNESGTMDFSLILRTKGEN